MNVKNNAPLIPKRDNISLLKNNINFSSNVLDPHIKNTDFQLEKMKYEQEIAKQTVLNDFAIKQQALLNASKAVKGAFSTFAGTMLMEFFYMLYRDKPFLGANFILGEAIVLAVALVIFHFGMCRDVFRLKYSKDEITASTEPNK